MSRRARLGWGVTGAASAILLAAFSSPVPLPGFMVPSVSIEGPPGDTLASAIPAFVIRVSGAAEEDRPLSLTLQISVGPDFTGALLVNATTTGDSARLDAGRLLPPSTQIFWRARVETALGAVAFSRVAGPRTTASWLRLLSPNPAGGVTLDTQRPTFRWQAAGIPAPPGPWIFELSIDNLATGQALNYPTVAGESFTVPENLETNTSYRWAITAKVASGERVTVQSTGTFVILQPTVPRLTLLYQNFPNPFPTSLASETCLWFDLHRTSRVGLTIHGIRGNLVRTIVPSVQLTGDLAAGRYGRGAPGSASACDPRFAWDGRADDGRVVPPGVYLVRLRTDSHESFKRILFRGR